MCKVLTMDVFDCLSLFLNSHEFNAKISNLEHEFSLIKEIDLVCLVAMISSNDEAD